MIHWLASYPKSGNTWVKLTYEAYITGSVNPNHNIQLIQSDNYNSHYQMVSPIPLDKCTAGDFGLLRGAMLLLMLAHRPSFICKTHCINLSGLIPKHLTDSAVYLIRDPRDVAISYASFNDISIDEAISVMENPESGLRQGNVYTFMSDWSSHVKSWLEKAEIVRYEDLLDDPLTHMARIFGNWGLTDIEKLKNALKLTDFDVLQRFERMHGFVEAHKGPFFRAGKSTWQEVLTDKQRKRVESKHGEVMKSLGYL